MQARASWVPVQWSDVEERELDAAVPFVEQLRRDVAQHARPRNVLLAVRCQGQGHPLLWLVASDAGPVPVACAAERGSRASLRVRPDGSPMTLEQWPADDALPVGSCRCGVADELDPRQLRAAVAGGKKKITVRPTPVARV